MRQLQADFSDPRCVRPLVVTAEGTLEHLPRRLERHGFVVVSLEGLGPPEACFAALETALGLGDPYVPALYRKAETKDYSAPYSDVRRDAEDHHPGFSTTAAQQWHVDGLLDEIGTVKTTILYCVRAADTGGETLLFDSVGAFTELRGKDPDAAAALMSADALTRRSTIPLLETSATGPAFAVDANGDCITRYTDNDTCVWNHSAGSAGALRRGLDHLRAKADDPCYRQSILLASGEALILRNDRLSHGRRAYVDTPGARRHLIRALYADAPVSPR